MRVDRKRLIHDFSCAAFRLFNEAAIQSLHVRKMSEQGPGRNPGSIRYVSCCGFQVPRQDKLPGNIKDVLSGRFRPPEPAVGDLVHRNALSTTSL